MTYNECLSMLTEEEQEKFVANLKNFADGWLERYEKQEHSSMTLFMGCAFPWGMTPEGADYWMDILMRF